MNFSVARSKLPTLPSVLLAIFSAILLVLAFPDFDFWFLAFFALVPLFIAIEREKESVIKSFILGWVFGTLFFAGSCWWLTFSFTTYGGIPTALAYLLLLIICSIVGVFAAIFASAFSFTLKRCGAYGILFAPILWTAAEFLRFNLTDNNWNAIGYSQAFSGYGLEYAGAGGVYLVGFLVLLFNLLSFYVFLLLRKYTKLKKSRKESIAYILVLTFVGSNIFGSVNLQPGNSFDKPIPLLHLDKNKLRKYAWRFKPGGKVRLSFIGVLFIPFLLSFPFFMINSALGIEDFEAKEAMQSSPATNVVVVQANVPMSGLNETKWLKLRQRHVELAENALLEIEEKPEIEDHQPKVIIFPESPMNFTYGADSEFRAFIGDFARKHNAFVLFNSAEPNPKGENYFNSAIMINPRGEKIGQYDKIHLVPFGEFAPVPSPIKPYVPTLVGNFQHGENYNLFPVGEAQAGIVICYESHFASLSREFVRRGADVLIEMTNDGYLGNTGVLRQHLASAIFRAVETNRPVLRATNVGITAFVNERGEVLDAADVYTEATRVWTVSKSDGGQTFYVRYGDWFAWLCSIISLGLLFFCFWKKRNASGDL